MAIIQVDVDGVLADFMAAFTSLALKMGVAATVSGTPAQRVWETYGDVPAKDVPRVWEHIRQSRDFWTTTPPLVSKNTFLRLEDMHANHDIYFVTARVGKTAKAQTTQWLGWQGIHNPTVIICSRKGEMAQALKADYAIDDKAGNTIFTAYYAPKTRSYVLDWPYNQFDPAVVGEKVRRVRTVDDFLDDVEAGK